MDKRRKPFVHGTVGGHTRHRRLNEAPCQQCRDAFNEHVKNYQKANPEKAKAYAKKTYEKLKNDPVRWAARMERNKKYPRKYDYQAYKEYQKWYYENVRKPRKLENSATE